MMNGTLEADQTTFDDEEMITKTMMKQTYYNIKQLSQQSGAPMDIVEDYLHNHINQELLHKNTYQEILYTPLILDRLQSYYDTYKYKMKYLSKKYQQTLDEGFRY